MKQLNVFDNEMSNITEFFFALKEVTEFLSGSVLDVSEVDFYKYLLSFRCNKYFENQGYSASFHPRAMHANEEYLKFLRPLCVLFLVEVLDSEVVSKIKISTYLKDIERFEIGILLKEDSSERKPKPVNFEVIRPVRELGKSTVYVDSEGVKEFSSSDRALLFFRSECDSRREGNQGHCRMAQEDTQTVSG